MLAPKPTDRSAAIGRGLAASAGLANASIRSAASTPPLELPEEEDTMDPSDLSAKLETSDIERRKANLKLLLQFAEQMQKVVAFINDNAFQQFELRIGECVFCSRLLRSRCGSDVCNVTV